MKVFAPANPPSFVIGLLIPFFNLYSMNPFRPFHPLVLIRIAICINMLIHGITRLSIGGVTPFDGYLSSLGFPPYTAWVITIFEIIGALLLLFDKWTVPLCLLFCAELIMGIALVHFPEGWFVVGAGRNGMEFSVLLIVCFIAVIAGKKYRY